MSPERLAKSVLVFEGAIGLQGGELQAFLDHQCGADDELRREVERLLMVQQSMDQEFLEEATTQLLDPANLRRGVKLGRYEIQERIGAGGMGTVYRAQDSVIGRPVALKLLRPSGHETQSTQRFLGELRMLGALQLENVVRLYDFGEFRGLPYLVMEFLQGEDLAKAIASNHCEPLSVKLDIARQIAASLRDVHAARIVHRDLKPGNVFVEPSGRVKLMDFGIARQERPAGALSSMVLGTPEYMSPEQVNGEAVSFPSDIYSYGVLLFELFSGTRPHEGNSGQVMRKVVSEPVPLERLHRLQVPKHIIDLIAKATSKDSSRRIQNFDLVLAELNQAGDSGHGQAASLVSRKWIAAVIAATAMAAGFPLLRYLRPETTQNPAFETVRSQTPETSSGAVAVADAKPTDVPRQAPAQAASDAATVAKSRALAEQKSAETQKEDETPRRTLDAKLFQLPPQRKDTPILLPVPQFDAGLPPARTVPDPLTGAREPVQVVASPPKVEKPPAPHSADAQEVAAVLERYAMAWRQKDLDRIHQSFPGASLRPIKQVFDDATAVDFQLTPQAPPRFSGTEPLVADVQCLRRTSQSMPNRPAKVSSELVSITLERSRGTWHIVSIH